MQRSDRREKLIHAIDAAAPKFKEVAQALFADPELGLNEKRASDRLCKVLEAEGFNVERGVADLPTSFIATRGESSGKPVIAIIAEYDALPSLGHACGHNLIATSALISGVGLTQTLSPKDAQIRIYGCPAEETYGGKVQMVDRGLFADVDAALMVHGFESFAGSRPMVGRKSIVVEYRGKSAHAGAWPEEGVNALDAMILLFSSVGLMRQQMRAEGRVHGIITHGGAAANMIPDYTRAEFYVRAHSGDYMEELARRFEACARGAAHATGTTITLSNAGLTMLPIRENQALAHRWEQHVKSLGGQVNEASSVIGGSTDFGNVSQVIPGIHSWFRIAPDPIGAHTPEFARAAGSDYGYAGMVTGAKAMALTALDLVESPEFLKKVREEFGRGK